MGTIQIDGSTPKLTIGNATAEDASIVYDGNAKDFYIALDDSSDKLVIGEGSTVGTNSILTITDDSVTVGDAAAVDTKIVFDGNAQDYYVGLDDSADTLVLGLGSTLGTTPAITINSSQVATFAQNPVFPDGGVAVADLDIDGATDIGAAVVDADLFIIDDGAGGTNRKVTASRIKTYAGASGDITTIDSILNTDVKIGEDDQTKIDFETANEIHFYADNAEQVYVADGVFGPQTDADVDLGTSGVEWKDAYFDGTVTADAGLFDTLGIVTAKDLGAGLHIRTADSGGSAHANADELVIEGSGNSGLTIASGNSNNGCIFFSDDGDNNIGYIEYKHGTNAMTFGTNAANAINIDSAGAVNKPLQPAFLVKPSTGQDNIAIDSNVTVVWGTEIYDVNADFASNTFTAPVTGKYQLNVSMRIDNLDNATVFYQTEIVTSNRAYAIIISTETLDEDAPYGMPFMLSCLADMDASDTAYVRINTHNSGTAQADIHEDSRFSGYLAC